MMEALRSVRISDGTIGSVLEANVPHSQVCVAALALGHLGCWPVNPLSPLWWGLGCWERCPLEAERK